MLGGNLGSLLYGDVSVMICIQGLQHFASVFVVVCLFLQNYFVCIDVVTCLFDPFHYFDFVTATNI